MALFFIKKGKFPVFVKMFSEAMSRFDSSYVRGRNMAALFLNPSSAPPLLVCDSQATEWD